MEQGSFQHYLIGLLAIGNNVPAIGAFLMHTQGLPRAKVQRTILVSSAACLAMLLLFMLLGSAVLRVFGISISSFQIAGGILLGLVGIDMIQSRQAQQPDPRALDAAMDAAAVPAGAGPDAHLYASAVVPIAIPLTVGAGTFSAVTLYAELAHRGGSSVSLLAAIVALVLVNAVVFSFSARIVRVAGAVGLRVFTRIMGLFTLAIGVEFVLRGLSAVYLKLQTG